MCVHAFIIKINMSGEEKCLWGSALYYISIGSAPLLHMHTHQLIIYVPNLSRRIGFAISNVSVVNCNCVIKLKVLWVFVDIFII